MHISERNPKETARDYALRTLRDNIVRLELEPGSMVSENVLASEMGLSRTPVRDAVHLLYQEGYLDILPNKGFTLHKMTEQDVMETYEVRCAIEGYCCRKLAGQKQTGAGKKLAAKLEASCRRQEEIFSASRDPETFSQEDQHFHWLLVEASENDAFQEFFRQYMYKLQRLAALSLQKPRRMEETLAEHRRILQAIREGDPAEAYQAALDHIQAPLNINLENVYAGLP